MKKLTLFILAMIIAAMILTGCGAQDAAGEKISSPASQNEQSSSSAESLPAESETPPPSQEPLTPIYGNQIQDGTYKIEVSSSSSMFRIIDAQLTVANAEMSAFLTLSGTGYEKLYMGTGEEALADSQDKYIYFVEDSEGKYTYQVPVDALDQEIDCAAWSIRKEKWYDRTLVFHSSLLPSEAISSAAPAALPTQGEYQIQVSLSGGTGRAEVASPTKLTVAADGAATATIVWSSPYYENMTVSGISYSPVSMGETSTFEIPVVLDTDMAVSATTIAMSEPHEIDYTLYFDTATMKPLE